MMAQSKLKVVGIENIEVFPGNVDNLLPFIKDNSIDTFIISLIDDRRTAVHKTRLLRDLFYSYNSKLTLNGTIQIIIGRDQNYEKVISLMPNKELKLLGISNCTISKDVLKGAFMDFEKLDKIKVIKILKTR